uniref:50S ribosomal protein L20 n=1 Tax=Risleya atropurpurea TaxID=1470428 RepID=A0A7D4WVI7_9ASPA|nr:ribosomal protein L20 [Risleya atropurpurea]
MTRVKRGYTARKRRKNIRLFASTFLGAHSRLTRTTIQQTMKALVFFHRDQNSKKRNFRRLWILRINAVTHEDKLFYSYNIFIHNLYKKQLLMNRKILAQIALSNKNCFNIISNKIIK